MKLATFDAGAGAELGAVSANVITPLSRAMPALGADMRTLIAGWDDVSADVRRAAEAGRDALPLASVRLLAPIPRPGKIMAIGLNYADHIAESGMDTPAHQVWFAKAATSATGPYAAVELPGAQPRVDYEAELVAVVGRGGRDIAASAASGAVFGYCVGNDVTERAWQHRTPQWTLGKSFDTHAPFGPWITTADEIGDPHRLAIRAWVNGELRQASNTKHLVFDVWAQVEHLSAAMTLEPGDVIFTGTPGGVGAAMKPMRFLRTDDVVKVEIDMLGHIENRCEARP
jgi:ureidoglycolate lyase